MQYPDPLGKGLEMWATGQLKPSFAVKMDYICFSLLVLLDLLHWVGIFKHLKWDFLFYLPVGGGGALLEWCHLLLPRQLGGWLMDKR